ncbi:unnamed protein product [Caenorhabditis auriculariae]|uniref:Uncharacterized protein n=1 Tax=Caenorhabditis auriculariae TaxID=2777116 RepID=A0A8S1HNB6_9PELO|nr:unnamed protein product [Caenorhabditis auriculariae]
MKKSWNLRWESSCPDPSVISTVQRNVSFLNDSFNVRIGTNDGLISIYSSLLITTTDSKDKCESIPLLTTEDILSNGLTSRYLACDHLRAQNSHRWMNFCVAMAISTLCSDAILHIIPQIVGVHSHEHQDHHHHQHNDSHESNETEEHHHSHGHSTWYTITNERKVLLRLSIIIAAIYVLYFFEFVIYYRKKNNDEKKIIQCAQTISNHAWSDCEANNNNNGAIEKTDKRDSPPSENASQLGTDLSSTAFDEDDAVSCFGIKARAWVILLGDGVHNFVDGLAIGASFMSSAQLGIITTIAVCCHELPHEIGDLAVLLESGMSMCKALTFNLLSALTAFIGLYISIALGRNEEIELLLLAVTAGMFLYVAWIDMMAHLKHDGAHKDHWLLACFMQYSGFFSGFLLIFSLGWFEHDMFE